MELVHRSFAGHTPAGPARIWAALTDPETIPRFLHGLVLTSTWAAEATVDGTHPEGTVHGQVLCSRPPERLSYVLQAGPGDPPVYVTWLIRPSVDGSVLTLQVDEFAGIFAGDEDTDEGEDVWLPILARLQELLAAD